MITPQVNIATNRQNEFLMRNTKYPYDTPNHKTVWYKTYRKLKSDLKRLMREYSVDIVTVYRSRRGEWGEFYEHWHLSGNKLSKGKEGWS